MNYLRIIFLISILLILYGNFCRHLDIYFFWESESFGFTLMLLSISIIMIKRIKSTEVRHKWAEKIIFFMCSALFVFRISLLCIIPNTSAYTQIKAGIENDQAIKGEVGKIMDISFIPYGGMNITKNTHGEYGYAHLKLIVKGTKKYIDLFVSAVKNPEADFWIIKNYR